MLASAAVARGLIAWPLEHSLNSCGTRAQLPRDMWDLLGPRIEPVSLALSDRYFTTKPHGKL